MFTIAPLLIHSADIPSEARSALEAAYHGPPEQRARELESAARILYRETELDCGEVRELVGLPEGACS